LPPSAGKKRRPCEADFFLTRSGWYFFLVKPATRRRKKISLLYFNILFFYPARRATKKKYYICFFLAKPATRRRGGNPPLDAKGSQKKLQQPAQTFKKNSKKNKALLRATSRPFRGARGPLWGPPARATRVRCGRYATAQGALRAPHATASRSRCGREATAPRQSRALSSRRKNGVFLNSLNFFVFPKKIPPCKAAPIRRRIRRRTGHGRARVAINAEGRVYHIFLNTSLCSI
jgi:hypothetical protein